MTDPVPPSRLAALSDTAKRVLPDGTRGREAAAAGFRLLKVSRNFAAHSKKLLRESGDVLVAGGRAVEAAGVPIPSEPYALWLNRRRPKPRLRQLQESISRHASDPVKVSMLVLVSDPNADLAATLRSVHGQTWSHVRPETVNPANRNGHELWSAAAAAALEGDGRDFVVFVQAGDVLEPDAAFHIADAGWRDPALELVSWDDDLVGPGGFPTSPRFRPAWSPDMLLGANYLGRSFAIRRRKLVEVGGLHPELGQTCLWDLLLRGRFRPDQVGRITRVVAHVASRDDDIAGSDLGIVRDHLAAAGSPALVESVDGMVRVRWQPARWPAVTIVIPTRHNRPLVTACLRSLEATDYPSMRVIIVDNGGRSDERQAWYDAEFPTLNLEVMWWDEPFNYSAVNNAAARRAEGDVLVFLNDDTEAIDPAWLKEMASWADRPGIGVVGMQLIDPQGLIQHGGVVLGMRGLAEHLFQAMTPRSPSLLGPTTWYRNLLAVTGACLAVRRDHFEQAGGFDERLVLCGSDVVLGLEMVGLGLRNLCLPFPMVRHCEGATRRNYVPVGDVFASYWHYQRWIFGGDPYFSPHLSLDSPTPKLKSAIEMTPAERLSKALSRRFEVFRQANDEGEALALARMCRSSSQDIAATQALHAAQPGHLGVRTINWFLPAIDSPFYGGINTALRIADHLARHHGVENRYVIWGDPNELFIRSALAAAFPVLATCPITFYQKPNSPSLHEVDAADVAIATQWVTAYAVTNFPHATRKAYLIQDFEPMFYPAGTKFALAEATYRMGLYGICNSANLERLYREGYGGAGMAFTPAVDRSVFHPHGRAKPGASGTTTVFLYSRPGHWRNCWELASVALAEAKRRLGDRVRFVTAGSWARPEDLGTGLTHLGLLDYKATGDLYRRCDIGIALTVSEHPSYLPLELMACGAAVLAFDKPVFSWLLRDGENCLRVPLNVDGLVDGIERLVDDHELRAQLAKQALADIDRDWSSWEHNLSGIYDYLCQPNRADQAQEETA